MTLANLLTLSRLLAAPLVAWWFLTEEYALAGVTFGLAALTDALDGWAARTRGEVTAWGKLFDPVADKLLQATAFLLLIGNGFVPLWLAVALIAKEAALLLGGLWFLRRGVVVSARWTGKAASAVLFPALTGGLAGLWWLQPLFFVGAGLSLLAGCHYLLEATRPAADKRCAG
jgi:cardiolipin synthase